ncbi:MAG TPA: hypothetical protein VMF13_13565, partial [Luteitalea sp.]|nr:hypothetical protein [Luteitalea sp.]
MVRLLALAATAALLLQSPGIDEALRHPVLAPDQTRVDTQAWTASKVPALQLPASRDGYDSWAKTLRARVLDEVVYRGAAREWRTQAVKVESFDVLPGDGYQVRKIRFEAVPGLHVPALVYEPVPAPTRPTPVVLNFNGHEGTGVGNSY